MMIKAADDKTQDLEALRALYARPDVTNDVRARIDQEIRNIQSGIRGEAEAAYEIEFHYGQSQNWMSIHDLRIQCGDRVAQIDHLLVNRVLEIYVCESKRFAEGVPINEQGEFTAFYNGRAYGVASPLEQNRRHIAVLEAAFKSGQVPLPRRLGFALSPRITGLVLVSKTARITRPKARIEGIDAVIKNDQLNTRIKQDIDDTPNLAGLAKMLGLESLREFAQRLAEEHVPQRFNWAAKFGLPAMVPPAAPLRTPASNTPAVTALQAPSPVQVPAETKSKLVCSRCGCAVAYNVARFCWFNKPRFGGLVYCMDCQKSVPTAT